MLKHSKVGRKTTYSRYQFEKDATESPDINFVIVGGHLLEELWCTIPGCSLGPLSTDNSDARSL